MTFATRGGPANSGTKRPLKERAADWTCTVCRQANAGFWRNCPNCTAERPS